MLVSPQEGNGLLNKELVPINNERKAYVSFIGVTTITGFRVQLARRLVIMPNNE